MLHFIYSPSELFNGIIKTGHGTVLGIRKETGKGNNTSIKQLCHYTQRQYGRIVF